MTTTPDLGIPLVAGQQAQPEITHNEALILLQALLNGVVDRGVNAPPGGPTEGDSYIIGAAPTGAWVGHANKIAIFYGGSWRIVPGINDNGTPIAIGARHEGLRLWVRDEDALYVWTQTGSPPALAWVELQTGGGGGAVDSVFGRTGAVVAATSDYDAGQVDYDNGTSGLAATDVQGAIDEVAAAGGGGGAPERLPTLSNNTTDATNDVDFTVGSAWDSTDAVKMTCPAMTKRLDAGWAPGSGNGGRNSEAAIADTMYRWYAVSKAGGADADYYAHTSDTVATVLAALQAESGGADYVHARRIGNISRTAGAIRLFRQTGDRFTLKTAVPDYDDVIGDARSLVTITAPPNTNALIRAAQFNASTNVLVVVQPTYEADVSPSGTNNPPGASLVNQTSNVNIVNELEIEVDNSSQLAVRSDTASTTFRVLTRGWIDRRGRD